MRIQRSVFSVVAVLATLGCRASGSIDLERANALVGSWELRLHEDASPGHAEVSVEGTVALLANRVGSRAAGIDGIPLAVGVHDLPISRLDAGLGANSDPDVAATRSGNSLLVIIGPGTDRPVRIWGAFRTDSITGRWSAYQRAGPSPSGDFSMIRR